jgi:putative membrane protein
LQYDIQSHLPDRTQQREPLEHRMVILSQRQTAPANNRRLPKDMMSKMRSLAPKRQDSMQTSAKGKQSAAPPPTESSPGQRLAAKRTHWANQRTLLAKERTFSAWVRTGIASIAAGLGLARLLTSIEPVWLVKTMAAMFLATGAAIFALAFWRYRVTFRALAENGLAGLPVWMIGVLSALLLTATAAGLVLVFLE